MITVFDTFLQLLYIFVFDENFLRSFSCFFVRGTILKHVIPGGGVLEFISGG